MYTQAQTTPVTVATGHGQQEKATVLCRRVTRIINAEQARTILHDPINNSCRLCQDDNDGEYPCQNGGR